jgi:hypothetical protein
VWNEKANTYIWLDKTFNDMKIALGYAETVAKKDFGVVLQKVKRKQKGYYYAPN